MHKEEPCRECDECAEGITCREISQHQVSPEELHDAIASRDFSAIAEGTAERGSVVVLNESGEIDEQWTERVRFLLTTVSRWDTDFHNTHDHRFC